MVINSTNINKTNNRLSSRENLNSDGHQFHIHKKRPQLVMLEIQVLACYRHTNVAGLNWLMGSQTPPLDNWISNGNTYTNH